MGLLFPHNQTAYEAAIAMLEETGKACIIHPTGTGKSFIGFQLTADNPDKKILWLSPSEYIFRTQFENWQEVGGPELPNLSFLTYAKLMLLSDDELAELKPDDIVIDELHRAGACKWNSAVVKLISLYPKAKLLGLTATNICYLDKQRDMASELFDDNIASRMTLGEAIVRGILNPPKKAFGQKTWS